jgi:hypothetical protein
MKATVSQPPVPSKDTGFAKDPAGNTIDVTGLAPFPVQPNSPTLQNMPYKDGQ